MQKSIVPLLQCPLSGEKLFLEIIKEFIHPLTRQTEVHSGFLWSVNGGCYPIINGIPRMLPDSFLHYSKQMEEWWPEYSENKKRSNNAYHEVIKTSAVQNAKIRSTFGFEWNLLRKQKDLKIWNLDASQFKEQLIKELQLPVGYTCALALDAGCGHGRSARNMTMFSDTVIGVEVSPAVELAYEQNDHASCHIIQADIHYLPFNAALFDIVYSSGVLHHNISTKAALDKVAKLLKPCGILVIWLYHPFKNILHNGMRLLRSITRHMPVKMVYYLNAVSLTPIQWCISSVSGKKKKWTEIAIEQLDMLTPKYRHEHTTAEVNTWLRELHFEKITVTDSDNYGFSIKAEKQPNE